jgi:hypothetical protein
MSTELLMLLAKVHEARDAVADAAATHSRSTPC